MKTINSLRYLIAIISVMVFMLVLKSCKKADFKNHTPVGEKTIDELRANVAAQMAREGGKGHHDI